MARQSIIGTGFGTVTFLNEVVSAQSSVNGVFVQETSGAGVGVLVAQSASMSGSGTVSGAGIISGTGTLAAQASALSGTGTVSGTSTVTGTGALAAGAPPTRTNLILYSETFNNAAWGGFSVTVTGNTTTAPNGVGSADTLADNTSNADHAIAQYPVLTASPTGWVFSVYAKAWDRTWFRINSSNFTQTWANFDLINGVVGLKSAGATAQMQYCGDGWWRCSVSSPDTVLSFGANAILYTMLSNASSTTYVGDGGILYLWGAQYEQGQTPTAYIPTLGTSTFAPTAALSGQGVALAMHGAWNHLNSDDGNVTYSNGNRTATIVNTGFPYSTDLHIPGSADLSYAEVTIGTYAVAGNPNIYVGDYQFKNYVLISNTGDLYSSSTGYIGSYPALAWGTAGKVISFAYKASTNEAWFRVNGGAWNAGGTADPATGVGGVPVGAVLPVGILADSGTGTLVLNLNTGTTAFAYSVPSGYLPWYGTAVGGVTGTGVLAAQSASLSGIGTVTAGTVTGTGSLVAQSASLSGTGTVRSVATGALVSGPATLSGTGTVRSVATGALVAGAASLAGVGTAATPGINSGALVAGPASLSGVGTATSIYKLKVWSGSTWTGKPAKVWSGSAWATKPVKVWNGSAWVA